MKNNTTRVLASVVVLSLVSTTPVLAESINKDETIFINLDENGNVVSKTSSVHIKSDTSLKNFEDVSELKNIRNIKDNHEASVDGNNVHWNTDAKEVFYQGELEKELPVAIKITYTMDGKNVKAEEILGKSGNLRIQIEFINHDHRTLDLKRGGSIDGFAPYMVAAVLNLPTDIFTDVTVKKGKLIVDGNNQIVSFVSMPGMKTNLGLQDDLLGMAETVEIEALVHDFEMSSIMMTATDSIPNLESFDKVSDVNDVIEKINELKVTGDQLADGTKQLARGSEQLETGIKAYTDAVNQAAYGSATLVDKGSELNNGMSALKAGIHALISGSDSLDLGVNRYLEGVNQLSLGAVQLANQSAPLFSGIHDSYNGSKKLQTGIHDYTSGVKQLHVGSQELASGMTSWVIGAKNLTHQINNALETLTPTRDSLLAKLENIDTDYAKLKASSSSITVGASNLAGGNETLDKEVEQAIESLTEQRYGLEEKANSLNHAIQSGTLSASELEEANVKLHVLKAQSETLTQFEQQLKTMQVSTNELSVGARKLSDGSSEFNDAIISQERFVEDLSKINVKDIKAQTSALQHGIKELDRGAETISTGVEQFALGTHKLDQSSPILNQGIDDLVVGLDQLNAGSKTFKAGLESLKDGALTLNREGTRLGTGAHELNLGMSTLSNSSKPLVEGVTRYTDGVTSLNNGMHALDLNSQKLNYGIKKLNDGTHELNSGITEGINDLRDHNTLENIDMNRIIDVSDSLMQIAKASATYSGQPENVDGSVKFVYRTNAVEKEKESKKVVVEETQNTGFFAWLKNKFNH